jgi:SAM-dependent methyltransferase
VPPSRFESRTRLVASARLPGQSSWSSSIAAVKTFATLPGHEHLRRVPCALCGGSTFARLWECGDFRFVRCRGCGLIQQNPQSEPTEVASRYDESYLHYEEQNQFAFRDLELLALGDVGLATAAEPLFARAREEGRKPRVLDAGCATGALLDALRDLGWEPQGVEISVAQAGYGEARFGLPICAGTLESATFPVASFDLVHASHLIEHLGDPAAFLDEAARVLATGGLLALTTPNADGLQARLFGPRWRSAIYDHLYLFSLRTLLSLLEPRPFAILAFVTWGGWARGLRPAFVKRPLDHLAKRLGFGDVVAILARRL